jgi:hypothetical protein
MDKDCGAKEQENRKHYVNYVQKPHIRYAELSRTGRLCQLFVAGLALLEIFWQGEAFALGKLGPAIGEYTVEKLGEAARPDITAAAVHQGCRQSPEPERVLELCASGKGSQDRKIEDRKMESLSIFLSSIFLSLFLARKDCVD